MYKQKKYAKDEKKSACLDLLSFSILQQQINKKKKQRFYSGDGDKYFFCALLNVKGQVSARYFINGKNNKNY